MLGIVVSRADEASVHIGERLRSVADWRTTADDARSDAAGGGTVYRREGVEMRAVEALHLDTEGLAAAFDDPDLLVFASRHAGETGPLLTAHHTGNFGPAEFGGDDHALARACPNAHSRVLAALSEHAPEGYEVGTECTHHGPTDVGAPSMFVEVGSDRPQWEDPEAAEAVARAILDLVGVPADAPLEGGGDASTGGNSEDGPDTRRRHLVGFGGGHYAPRFERIARETDWAVGHVGADWALSAMGDPREHREVIGAAFERSRATRAVLADDRPALRAVVADLGYRVVDETWVRETDGVPLGLLERVEDRLGPVDAGVRFGERAEADGPLAVVDLPGDLRDAAQGIDADRARAAVAREAVAFETTEGGTLLGERAAVADPGDRGDIVAGLAGVLEAKYDSVTVEDDAVVATREAFDPGRARTLGVSEGPAFGKLSAGQAVEVDGERIDPAAVHVEETDRFEF